MNPLWIIPAIFGSAFFIMAYLFIDRVHVFVRRLFGAKAIHIKGVSSAISGECWIAIMETDPFGGIRAFRYPGTKLGHVTLNEDGTGYYCGAIIWKPA